MKIFPLLILIMLPFINLAQRSIFFAQPLPTKGGAVAAVDRVYYGTYKSPDEMINYIFDEKGISVFSTTVSSISKEMIRENGKYDVRNGYLFGVVAEDSVPCVLEKDRYYFGVRSKQQIVGEETQNKLSKIKNGEYIINTWEDGNYIPSHLKFTSSGIEFTYFDYDEEDVFFNDIENKKSVDGEYFQVLILDPNLNETNELLKQKIFSDVQKFTKN